MLPDITWERTRLTVSIAKAEYASAHAIEIPKRLVHVFLEGESASIRLTRLL